MPVLCQITKKVLETKQNKTQWHNWRFCPVASSSYVRGIFIEDHHMTIADEWR